MGVEVSDPEAGRWTIDPVHPEITFAIRHLMTTVRGWFSDFGDEIAIALEIQAVLATADAPA